MTHGTRGSSQQPRLAATYTIRNRYIVSPSPFPPYAKMARSHKHFKTHFSNVIKTAEPSHFSPIPNQNTPVSFQDHAKTHTPFTPKLPSTFPLTPHPQIDKMLGAWTVPHPPSPLRPSAGVRTKD